ncbi:MAG TPA: hypothetical protein VF218_04345 [Acidothermaceae bacterium]
MSLPGDELDRDERLTSLAVFEHELAASDERAVLLEALLAKLENATSDGERLDIERPDIERPDVEPALQKRCYRQAAVSLAGLAGPITRSLADFLG